MARKRDPEVETLDQALKARTREGALGALYEKLDSNKVRCFSCGHRCLILDGHDGICKVRFNRGGTLYVPRGYVAGLQVDPIEKKPFFHAFPGADALSFGMLGCDYHCGYCFPGDTRFISDRGPMTLAAAFASCERVDQAPGAEIGYPKGIRAVTSSGVARPVRAVFKHPFRGTLRVIRPFLLPPIRCTPDHRVFATLDPAVEPAPVHARDLTAAHLLAIPRRYSFSKPQTIDVAGLLTAHTITYSARWKLGAEVRREIVEATARGERSRQIGERLGFDASYVRHVRVKMADGRGESHRSGSVLLEDGLVRFPNERRPGIAGVVSLDVDVARLLGYYCGEGSVVHAKDGPNSLKLEFSFSHAETTKAEEVRELLGRRFGVRAQTVRRQTTLAVTIGKASLAVLFRALCGSRATGKRVPAQLFDAHRDIAEAFLDAYVSSDGHRYANGKVSSTTVSPELAHGLAWLALKLGRLPAVYDYAMSARATILGRQVNRAPRQLTVVWYENGPPRRTAIETERFHLVRIREIATEPFEGAVFNLEVEDEHEYLAGMFLVSNCQNWLTSQALRDPSALSRPRDIEPAELVAIARSHGAPVMVTTYNEPLITSEWAVEIFSLAKQAGITCGYVSNGNGTPEVLAYIRPYVDLYKVDLKSFRDPEYRRLGGTLERVLDTLRRLPAMGFWLEVVTLVVPGFNDDPVELRDMARFLASISVDIPWHVTAFKQDYRMQENPRTTAADLLRACEIGREEGLRYVYAGNLPGHTGDFESTRCWKCGAVVIDRLGYYVRAYRLTPEGTCPECATPIAGFWRRGWQLPEQKGGFLGRRPRALPLAAGPLFPPIKGTNKEVP